MNLCAVKKWFKGISLRISKALRLSFENIFFRQAFPLWPLCPVVDSNEYDKYCHVLDQILRNKEIKNIAITGRYGAGKSSFLKTFFTVFRRRHFCKRVIWVTLGKLGEYEGEMPIEESAIERAILQQILVSADPNSLPFTRLLRISVPNWRTYVTAVLFVSMVFLCYLGLSEMPVCNGNIFFETINSIDDGVWFFVIACLASSVVSLVVAAYSKMLWSLKIHYMGVDLKMEMCSQLMPLDRFLDEILYFFQVQKVSFVVFEDIDRFDRPHLFAKLSELNHVINQAGQIPNSHKPIRFLYAIKDSIIGEAENRVKFFDYILPIVPVCTAFNSREHLISHISKVINCRHLTSDYQAIIKAVAPYISDMRIVNCICNDFAIVRARLTERARWLSQARLLGMIVFKNLLPTAFDEMQSGRGVMRKVLELKEAILCRQIKINQDRIKERPNKEDLTVDSLSVSDTSVYDLDLSVSKENKKAARDIQSIKRKSLRSLVERNELTVDDLSKKLNPNGRNNNLYTEDEVALIHILIGTGCLGEDYASYITLFAEGRLCQADRDFELAVFRQKALEFDYALENVREIISDIEDRYFGQFAILNIDLVEYLICHRDEYKRQLNLIRTQFSSMTADKFTFVSDFLRRVDVSVGRMFLEWLLSAQRNYVGLLCGYPGISKTLKFKQYAMILRNCLDKSKKLLSVPPALIGLLANERSLDDILTRYEINEQDFTRLITQGNLKFRNPQIAKTMTPLSKIVYSMGAYTFDRQKWRIIMKGMQDSA